MKLNETLLNLILKHRYQNDYIEKQVDLRYVFLGDGVQLFEDVFYPLIINMDEKEKRVFAEKLSDLERETLISIPENLIRIKTLGIIENIEDIDGVMEFDCYERVVKSYKHPEFFELLQFISIDKKYSLDKENHNFGYHFHLFEKSNRTATLLTFDPDETPNRTTDKDYSTFDHTLYYESHSEGSTKVAFKDLNSKSRTFRKATYEKCSNILINNIEKLNFKKPSQKKSNVLKAN